MTAYVFLAEGFEEVEALTPVDILRRGGVTVKTVGIGGRTVTGSHGIPVVCDIAEEDVIPDEIDMMVLPGGLPGTTHLGESLTVQEGLAYAAQEDLWVAAICAAPSVLGENGLLHGRKYTCYPGFENDEKYHGTYTAAPLQQDGKIITANGAGNAMTFALYLLAALQGIPLEELGKTPTGSNTAVSLLRAEGARIQVVWRDDASHLTDPAFTQGCTVKQRANGLEPGLYFRPLAREQAEFPAAWAGTSGALSAGAPVLAGYLDGTPVGAVAFDDGRESERGCGWIPLLAVAEPWRRRGYGVQLIGQAVMHYRPMGRDRLRLPTPETEAAAGFYREFGFSPAADGPAWEKFIGYDPEFLGT